MTTRTAKRTMNPYGKKNRTESSTVYPTICVMKDISPVATYPKSSFFGWFLGKTDRFYTVFNCRVDLPLRRNYEFITRLTIPAGFKTDGVSTPQMLWPLFPPHGLAFNAATVHDYLYETTFFEKRSTADHLFLDLMLAGGVPKLQAYIMYGYVRLAGWRNWKRFKRKI
jgi:hypothetical protein